MSKSLALQVQSPEMSLRFRIATRAQRRSASLVLLILVGLPLRTLSSTHRLLAAKTLYQTRFERELKTFREGGPPENGGPKAFPVHPAKSFPLPRVFALFPPSRRPACGDRL